MKTALAAAALALALPAFAGKPASPRPAVDAPRGASMMSLSLVEALAAIHQPQLAGIFSFVAEADAPFAFADFLARDKKAMKLYLGKLGDDRTAANGLTDWDHGVCASLVNLYASPMAATFGAPEPKRMKEINDCVLSPVVSLEDIVARRKR